MVHSYYLEAEARGYCVQFQTRLRNMILCQKKKNKNKRYTVVLCLFIASWLESQVLSNIIYRTLNRFSVKYILIRLTPYRQEPLQILSLPRHLYKAVNGANFTRDILHGVLFGSQGCIDGLKAEGSSWGLA